MMERNTSLQWYIPMSFVGFRPLLILQHYKRLYKLGTGFTRLDNGVDQHIIGRKIWIGIFIIILLNLLFTELIRIF